MDFTLSWEKSLAQYRYKYLALYHALRSRIRDGSLPEGTRLPASRELAGLYGLSRGSVAQAYDMLLAEGYVSARVGRGTFVAAPFALEAGPAAVDGPAEKGAEGVDVQAWGVQAKGIEGVDVQAWRAQAKGAEGVDVQTWGAQAKGIEGVDVQAWRAQAKGAEGVHGQAWGAQAKGIEGVDADAGRAGAREIELSPWAQRLAALSGALREGAAEGREMAAQADPAAISFAGGGAQPPEAFPHAAWRSARARASAEPYGGSADVFGDAELRAAIAAHLRAARGIAANPASICCFSGSMQALALLSQLLLGEGARAVAEDPGYPGIRLAAAAAGAAVVPAGVDGRGIIPRDWDAQVLFVTPGRQFPTGAVLAPERRRELLAWARRRNAVIVEDDFDSEFRWAGQPMEPLAAQDRGERVVFVGSFTKTLFSALRIGYAVLPRPLVEPMRLAKALYEPFSPALLEQRTLARFMARGDYDKHLRRMRRIYGVRYDVFRRELENRLGGLFAPLPLSSGLHVYAAWRRSPEEYVLYRDACRRSGVFFQDVEGYWTGPHGPAACFFFAGLEPEAITEGLSRMERIGQKIWGDGIRIV